MSRMAGTALLIACTALTGAGTATARAQKADIAGEWVLDRGISDSAQLLEVPHAGNTTLTIGRSGDELRIITQRGPERALVRYPMITDPIEPKPVGTSGGGVGTIQQWEGNELVTVTPHMINGMTVTTVERRLLGADGDRLFVETTLIVQHGYEAASSTSKPLRDVYVRRTR